MDYQEQRVWIRLLKKVFFINKVYIFFKEFIVCTIISSLNKLNMKYVNDF